MMGLALYVFKLNLVIIAAWVLYRLLFRNMTFFRWNRYYLMASVLLSFLLPFIKLPRGSTIIASGDVGGINWEPLDLLVHSGEISMQVRSAPDLQAVLVSLYLLVSFMLLLLFLVKLHRLHKQMKLSKQVGFGSPPVYIQAVEHGSFSYFRRIYLDRNAWEDSDAHIYTHERVHALQLHSIDLMIMVFLCVVMWFNPFVFLLFKAVRENHEYLADAPARSGPENLAGYLICLRDETFRRHLPAAVNHFKSSTIKKRIIMLTNNRTSERKKAFYLLALPVFALLMMAFQVSGELPEKAGQPAVFPLPVEFQEKITQHYGKSIHPISRKEVFHRGVDIGAPEGTPVYATASGKVLEAGSHETWGKYVIIAHDESYSTRYTHLDEIKVKKGEKVEPKQKIATVGNTGLSTGPHLHYEVWKNGEHVNPADYY